MYGERDRRSGREGGEAAVLGAARTGGDGDEPKTVRRARRQVVDLCAYRVIAAVGEGEGLYPRS
jgi:hypothetical protein